jgi:hypothetical protein
MNEPDSSWPLRRVIRSTAPGAPGRRLGDAAMGLAVDDQRIDGAAHVIDRAII